MDEVEELHTRNLEWGCVANLIDKISDIEDKMEGHWDQLCDMIADMVTEEGNEKDPSKIFFDVYQFCFRLYYRLRSNPTKRPFNEIDKITISGKEYYRITNYDYKTFKWARKSGLDMMLSNDYIDLPSSKLLEKHKRAFDRRIK